MTNVETDSQFKEFDLSGQQLRAKAAIEEWYEKGDEAKPIFRLFGFAGTGKTTTIRKIIADLDLELGSDVLFGAYTGKAAMVMRKTQLPAKTIHSLIYRPVPPNQKECKEIHQKWLDETDEEEKKRIKKEYNEKSKIHFRLKGTDDEGTNELADCQLLVLDECSMVNDEMLRDILTFKVPLLVLGDPGQLPPIDGEGALTRAEPDIKLTEIHRQAADNPIIDFATRARSGIYIPYREYGTSKHVRTTDLSDEEVLKYDQILTGTNKTRKSMNMNIRKLHGYDSPYPMIGEKLICLKNDQSLMSGPIFNGMMAEVVDVGDLYDTFIELMIRRETDAPDAEPTVVKALRAHFDEYYDKDALQQTPWWIKAECQEFDYGYCITVHKAQGSQWENVLFYDDKFLRWDRPQQRRWAYTAITRAVQSITIAD